MNKIYIIEGHTGQYEDYTRWLVVAFSNEKEADEYTRKLNKILMNYGIHSSLHRNIIENIYENRKENSFEEIIKLDKKFCFDYNGVDYIYSELELR